MPLLQVPVNEVLVLLALRSAVYLCSPLVLQTCFVPRYIVERCAGTLTVMPFCM